MSEISIIGCGPAAMMIAHACDQHGIDFRIYGPGKPSFISGAQYLHRDVGVRFDGLRPEPVRYVHLGDEETYEWKIYEKLPEGLSTSWKKFPAGDVEAWPLIGIYQYLWGKFYEKISMIEVTLEQVMELGDRTITFNTAPLPALMPDAEYETEDVAILNGVSKANPFEIVYNGTMQDAWYRSSNLWGYQSIEFPAWVYYKDRMDKDPNVRLIQKPLKTDAFIPNVHLSGRYGRWEKGVLVDESYFQAIEIIKRS
jgi:hypothetical protein